MVGGHAPLLTATNLKGMDEPWVLVKVWPMYTGALSGKVTSCRNCAPDGGAAARGGGAFKVAPAPAKKSTMP